MRSLIHSETKKTSMAASNNSTSKNSESIQSLGYPPPIQEKLDHLKQVIQTGTPSIQLTKCTITKKDGTEYEGESGESCKAEMETTPQGKAVAKRLGGLTCAYSQGNADQFSCAEPHALADFVNDTPKKDVAKEMQQARVGDAYDGSTFKPPCDRICSQWVWGEKGRYFISKIVPSKKELGLK